MKLVTTLLSAALIAGASTVAMAQSGGGSGSDLNPNQMGRGADANPSGLNADPMAGNRGNTMQSRFRPGDGRQPHGRHDLVQRVRPVERRPRDERPHRPHRSLSRSFNLVVGPALSAGPFRFTTA